MNIDAMLDSYADWIRSEIVTAKFGEYTQITTPFLDHLNDYIQIYVKVDQDGQIKMSDDGYIINNLALSGVSINRSPTRKQRLEKTLRSFGVSMIKDEIISSATVEDFPQKKHLFIQALLRIDDMFTTSQSSVKDLFNDDVKSFFDAHNIYYSENLSVVGKTGGVHPYDFHFQRSKNQPERFCKTINRLTQTTSRTAIFGWLDTEDVRDSASKLIVLINDENPVKPDAMNALRNYSDRNIEPICFSDADKSLETFCA